MNFLFPQMAASAGRSELRADRWRKHAACNAGMKTQDVVAIHKQTLEYRPSGANSCSATQVPSILWSSKIHWHVARARKLSRLYPDESKWITAVQKHCGLTCSSNSTALLIQPSPGHLHCWYSQAPDTRTVDTSNRRTLALLIHPSAGHLHCWYIQAPDTCIVDKAKRRTLALLIHPIAGH